MSETQEQTSDTGWIILALVITVVLAVGVWWFFFRKPKDDEEEEPTGTGTVDPYQACLQTSNTYDQGARCKTSGGEMLYTYKNADSCCSSGQYYGYKWTVPAAA